MLAGVRLYADLPGVRARQFVTDLLVVVWIYLWIRAGAWLYDQVERLAAPGRTAQNAGSGLADNLAGAGSRIDDVPGVGGSLASPFNRAADAARGLADAGRQEQMIVHDLAWIMAIMLVAVPLGLVLFGWLPLRVRGIRRAAMAAALRGTAGRDLLALRALASQPLRRLTALDPDIAGAWRRGDPAAVEALAALELRRLGLRPAG
jgi:hypothetical protein